jgi:hypothetical protein
VHVRIYDPQGRRVRDLGPQFAFSVPASLGLSSASFKPEQGALGIQAEGLAWAWNGENDAGEAVPNGAYVAKLERPGQPDLEAALWVEHTALDLGGLLLAPQPARTQVRAFLAPPSGVEVELRVYDLGGQLVAWALLPPGSTQWDWDLRSPSGQPVSAGVYLVEARYKGPGTRQSALRKLAVLR